MLRVCTHFTDFCHTRMSIDIFIFERNVMNVSNSNAKQMTISNTYAFQSVLCYFCMFPSNISFTIHSPISFGIIGVHCQWDILPCREAAGTDHSILYQSRVWSHSVCRWVWTCQPPPANGLVWMCSQCSPLHPNELGWPCANGPIHLIWCSFTFTNLEWIT